MRQRETRSNTDGKMHNASNCIRGKPVPSHVGARHAPKLLEMRAYVAGGEAFHNAGHTHIGDGLPRGPTVDESVVACR
jgi:hypothetical protein